MNKGRPAEAERLFLSLLESTPDDPDLRYHCALAQIQCGRAEAALQHAETLLRARPDWPGTHAIRGEALLSLGLYPQALKEFDWLAQRLSADPLARVKRGLALAALGEFDRSRAAFNEALVLDSAFVEDFCRQLSPEGNIRDTLDPRNIFIWRQYLARRQCNWEGWGRYVDEFRAAIADPASHLDRAFGFGSLQVPLSPPERSRLATKVAAGTEARVVVLAAPRAMQRSPKLRIGILSAGFREHVDVLLLLPLFELMDRRRFDIYAYSLGSDDRSAVRDRVRRAAFEFRDVSALSSASAAMQIRRDGIDVLVDTGGYGDGARFEITAARPSPVQVSYLCYPGTLGSRRVDYAILDSVVAPPGHEAYWAENIVRLPSTYFLYDFREQPPQVHVSRSEYGLPEDRPVLCAFHKGEKIGPDTFALWCRILRDSPSAVLWLLEDTPEMARNLREAAGTNGIDPQRLFFAGRERRERYLARLALADLFLDAIHHNAIVTACDCLLMGLPVITLHGTSCASLSAESILRAAGLGDLVARDAGAYCELVEGLLREPERLGRLRSRAEAARKTPAPLFDTAGRVRELEAAFEEMWRRHLAGQRPGPFDVLRHGSARAGRQS